MIAVDRDTLSVRFDRFDLEAYRTFLRAKRIPEASYEFDEQAETYRLVAPARFAHLLGVDAPAAPTVADDLAPHLFDYQRHFTQVALAARRYAVWADCGLGKTAIFLEWARQVARREGGRVLILSPKAVIPQTVEMATTFYGAGAMPISVLDSRDDLAKWCRDGYVDPAYQDLAPKVAISNYEKLIPGVLPELRWLTGLVLDESSILKSGGGVIKWNVIKSARGIPHKLSCTATPAPNDTMEYASQASFLEKLRSEGEILWTFFSRTKGGDWQVKPHARDAFYRFMASWSIYLRNPARFGFADNLAGIPEPVIRDYVVEATPEQLDVARGYQGKGGALFLGFEKIGVTTRSKWSQIAKGFVYQGSAALQIPSRKPDVVADLVAKDRADGLQVLVWTVFDEEARILAERIPGAVVLDGHVPAGQRPGILERFRTGETRVLVSKASLIGYGLNFQHCGSMVFSGWDDSYERWYQAIRRAYRYGQTRALRVHVPYVPELEGAVLENVLRKKASFERDTAIQEENYRRAMAEIAAWRA